MCILCTINFNFFLPIYHSNEIIISYGFHPFDICKDYPTLWETLKKVYIFISLISNFFIGNFIYTRLLRNMYHLFSNNKKSRYKNSKSFSNTYDKKINFNSLNLKIGKNIENNETIIIPESGLYQNFLVTGTIGSGKTSSAMYPFTKQLMEFNYRNTNNKIGMLILDVKGNYYKQVKKFAKEFNLINDLIVLELGKNIFYNPLHKPNLKANVLANRLKTILLLFSENNSESYWLDKAEEVLCECIKLCRLYNNRICHFCRIT